MHHWMKQCNQTKTTVELISMFLFLDTETYAAVIYNIIETIWYTWNALYE